MVSAMTCFGEYRKNCVQSASATESRAKIFVTEMQARTRQWAASVRRRSKISCSRVRCCFDVARVVVVMVMVMMMVVM